MYWEYFVYHEGILGIGSQANACPSGYCAPCKVTLTGFECKSDLSRQCDENRIQNSILCSECLRDHSIVLSDDDCYQFSSTYIILPLILIIVATARILNFIFMYVMNTENYQKHINNINAFFSLWMHCINISRNSQFRNFAYFSTQVPFKNSVSLFHEMTNLDMVWIQFFFSFIITLLLLGILA